MFNFLIKRKPVILDCFVNSERVAATYPIMRAFNYVPEWWRRLDNKRFIQNKIINRQWEAPTMKTCPGFVDLYKTGFIIPLWTDVDFFITDDSYTYQAANAKLIVGTHPSDQYEGAFQNHIHLKISSPWLFKEKSGIKFLYGPCLWSSLIDAPDILVLQGVVDYEHNNTTHINCLCPKQYKQFRLEAGIPLVHLLPLTDKKVNVKIHVVDDAEHSKMSTLTQSHKFRGGYFKTVKQAKECPMRDL